MYERKATVTRKTNETDIFIKLDINGNGVYSIDTPNSFFNHMLEQLSKHSLIDLEIVAKGDIEVDYHHLIEDTGIALGEAFKKAVGDKKYIERYGFNILMMDDAVVETSLDLSGRPYLIYNASSLVDKKIKDLDLDLFKEFFYAFVYSFGINLYINVKCGSNAHHIIEAIFKSFARSLRSALQFNEKIGLNSTKGKL